MTTSNTFLRDDAQFVGASSGGPRYVLTTATNFYYKPSTGSNSTGDGSSSNPWAGPQAANFPPWSQIDFGGQTVTLNLLETTTTQFIPKAWTGGGALVLDLGGFAINAVSQDCIRCTDALPGVCTIQNGSLSNSGSGFFSCINHQGGGTINIGAGLSFGAVLAAHMTVVGGAAGIFIPVSYTIAGNGQAHMAVFLGGSITQATARELLSGPQVTITGARTFSSYFVGAFFSGGITIRPFNNAGVNQSPYVVGTSVTGTRYSLGQNASISTLSGGPNFFPGTVAGVNDGTGIYT